MWNSGGFRSAALERAKAQLSGKRATSRGALKHDSQRDVASFGKALQSRQTPLQDLGDLSPDAESEEQDHRADSTRTVAEPGQQFGTGGGSRFLKKSANRQSSPGDTSEVKFIPQRSSQSVALSRLALIEGRFRNRKHNEQLGVDPGADLQSGLSVQSSSELSAADGSRFLKNKASRSKDQKEPEGPRVHRYVAPARAESSVEKGVRVDSDEEEVRRLLGESLDSTDGVTDTRRTETSPQLAVKTYRKSTDEASQHKEEQRVQSAFAMRRQKTFSPSPPASPKSHSPSRPFSQSADLTEASLSSASGHSEIRSLEELFPFASNHDDTLSERSVLSDDFKLNVMTLDDLAPVPLDIAGLPNKKTEASPRERSESSTAEILHKDSLKPEEHPAQYESDFESEIQTESENQISEQLSGGGEHSSIASEPQSLSAKSQTDDDYTRSEEPSRSASVRSKSSSSRSRGSVTPSYSNDATITLTEPQSRSRKDATVQTPAAGLTYTWSSGQAVLGPSVGMSYVDPTPVASHMISAETVEALTAYSPAVFALNDMLRQQLALTRSFIQSSRHLHQAMLESLGPADYRYTTLEDTKEFIRCNRPPRLTMEDALEEVLQDMRDYHYI